MHFLQAETLLTAKHPYATLKSVFSQKKSAGETET